jgi:hypothetical protein
MSVIIGIDPHKATHTAVAIHRREQPMATLQVVADRCQTQRLLAWAASFGIERTWAIESANGLGKLLAQQLLRAGEHVVDVPPTLSARVRLLGSTKVGKNDSNDALSTAIAGLRHCELRTVHVEDHTAVIRLLIDRYDGLVSLRTQATCRLHAVRRGLIAGGASRRLSANRAAKLLRSVHPTGLVAIERKRLAVISWPTSDASTGTSPRRDHASPTLSRTPRRPCSSCTVSVRSSPPPSSVMSATPPASHIGTVRFLQRHRPHRGVQRTAQTTPAQPARQPQAQPCHAPHCGHPNPQRHSRPRLLPTQAGRG